MIEVYINNEVNVPFEFKKIFKKQLKNLTKIHNIKGKTEVNLIITNDQGIRKISKQYKKKDKPTDVLSFPAGYKELNHLIGYNMLGDIYISYEHVKTQAKEYGHSEKREWAYLFVHGLLHLIGYNHITKNEENEMNEHAEEIMKKIKVVR